MARGLHGLMGLGADCVFLPGMVVPPSKDGLPLLSSTVWRFQAFCNSIRYKQAKIRVSSQGRTILYHHSRTSLDFSGKQCESAVGRPRPKREFEKTVANLLPIVLYIFGVLLFIPGASALMTGRTMPKSGAHYSIGSASGGLTVGLSENGGL